MYFLVERAMLSVKTSFFKMMFFEKDGSSKGWPWQSVARFLRVVDQCVPSARPRGRLGEVLL